MGKWNASAEGCHAGGDLFVTVPAPISLPFLSFCSFFSGAEICCPPPSCLSHPPFCSFSFCTSFHFSLPLFFPPLNHFWVNRKAHICNNSNYLHNDLPVTKHFQIHFLFSFGWWDNSVKWVGSECWYLFHRFLKRVQRSWTVGPRSGKPVGISLFSNPDFWAPEEDSSWNVLPNMDASESPVPTHWVWGRGLHPQNKPPRKNLCRSSLGINSSVLYLLPANWPCFVDKIGLLLFLFLLLLLFFKLSTALSALYLPYLHCYVVMCSWHTKGHSVLFDLKVGVFCWTLAFLFAKRPHGTLRIREHCWWPWSPFSKLWL